MATVREILDAKGPQVYTIGPSARVIDAALLMNEHRIGALVVTSSDRVAGMFTERDVLRRVVGQHRNPETTVVSDVMTHDVVCCPIDTSIEDGRSVMKQKRIRHLPVVDDDHRLVGLISIGDLNAYRLNDSEQTIYFLQEYLYGNV